MKTSNVFPLSLHSSNVRSHTKHATAPTPLAVVAPCATVYFEKTQWLASIEQIDVAFSASAKGSAPAPAPEAVRALRAPAPAPAPGLLDPTLEGRLRSYSVSHRVVVQLTPAEQKAQARWDRIIFAGLALCAVVIAGLAVL